MISTNIEGGVVIINNNNRIFIVNNKQIAALSYQSVMSNCKVNSVTNLQSTIKHLENHFGKNITEIKKLLNDIEPYLEEAF